MKPYEEKPIKVWTEVQRVKRVCEFGCKHNVRVVAMKRLGPVVEHRLYNNGYEKLMTGVRLDAQGRRYHQHIQIDYHSNTSWWRDSDKQVFYPSIGSSPLILLGVHQN